MTPKTRQASLRILCGLAANPGYNLMENERLVSYAVSLAIQLERELDDQEEHDRQYEQVKPGWTYSNP
jgi:hypothetical protein